MPGIPAHKFVVWAVTQAGLLVVTILIATEAGVVYRLKTETFWKQAGRKLNGDAKLCNALLGRHMILYVRE